MHPQKTWTITEIRDDGEIGEVQTGLTHIEAVMAIRRAMYGESEPVLVPSEASVHELPLAA
ncbi:MAG: hypothetical protein JST31_12065 [Actinobacteria bacterium]|nr:hypothetical protein [Actinomycetota bacterium]